MSSPITSAIGCAWHKNNDDATPFILTKFAKFVHDLQATGGYLVRVHEHLPASHFRLLLRNESEFVLSIKDDEDFPCAVQYKLS